VHSGHWGGLTTDPAILLAHALATIMDRDGKDPGARLAAAGRRARRGARVLEGCPVGGGEGAATIDEGWGEPGLTPAEKIYGWCSFIVLAMVAGRPGEPGQRRRAPTPARTVRSATRWMPIRTGSRRRCASTSTSMA
jgi:hypothetical protein